MIDKLDKKGIEEELYYVIRKLKERATEKQGVVLLTELISNLHYVGYDTSPLEDYAEELKERMGHNKR